MAFYTSPALRNIALRKYAGHRSASVLTRDAIAGKLFKDYDVFLSHSFVDADDILGLKAALEAVQLSVYVDWVDDPQLDRERVGADTAALLRNRMERSRCLLYASTASARNSKWMPWELGFSDARTGKVAIVPVTPHEGATFTGVEYLGLYPRVESGPLGPILVGNTGTTTALPEWIYAPR